MRIIKATECLRNFDFYSYRRNTKRQVPIAWGKQLLISADDTQDVVSLASEISELADLIHETYPDLTFVELARLKANLIKMNLDGFARILEKYQLTANENLMAVIDALGKAPENFKLWAHERKVMPRDLVPLRLSLSPEFEAILERIAAVRATRQIGCQILELTAELYLAGNPINEISDDEAKLNLNTNAESWLGKLKKLRYPRATKADEDMQNKIKALSWPSHVEAEWLRRGDQTGLQIKFFAQSESELNRRLDGIKNTKSLWTN